MSLIREHQIRGFRSFENQGVPMPRDDCFQNENNEVSDVLAKAELPETSSGQAVNSVLAKTK